MKGTTTKGFEFEIAEEVLDDMELVDYVAGVEENPLLLPKLCTKLLGEEQKKMLYDFYRTKDGRVPIQEVSDAITEIFSVNTEIKNSQSSPE